eukprot:MONOS_4130.1-p1 / transcript=MONOS_4130.1 / gene=MONOS_4130 / organism=Monocercomonoides_exilis_PA203 / gene_product=unspecified product / transcript_product=unspecified product / location=Mono_scaffold00106:2234-5368(-) / protein_length=844 / sequence_SO=supercontig / SO=protein_coding / is_pseudo=false
MSTLFSTWSRVDRESLRFKEFANEKEKENLRASSKYTALALRTSKKKEVIVQSRRMRIDGNKSKKLKSEIENEIKVVSELLESSNSDDWTTALKSLMHITNGNREIPISTIISYGLIDKFSKIIQSDPNIDHVYSVLKIMTNIAIARSIMKTAQTICSVKSISTTGKQTLLRISASCHFSASYTIDRISKTPESYSVICPNQHAPFSPLCYYACLFFLSSVSEPFMCPSKEGKSTDLWKVERNRLSSLAKARQKVDSKSELTATSSAVQDVSEPKTELEAHVELLDSIRMILLDILPISSLFLNTTEMPYDMTPALDALTLIVSLSDAWLDAYCILAATPVTTSAISQDASNASGSLYVVTPVQQICNSIYGTNQLRWHSLVVHFIGSLSLLSGSVIETIILESQMVYILVEKLYSSSENVLLEALWSLSNISAESSALCHQIANENALPLLIRLLLDDKNGILSLTEPDDPFSNSEKKKRRRRKKKKKADEHAPMDGAESNSEMNDDRIYDSLNMDDENKKNSKGFGSDGKEGIQMDDECNNGDMEADADKDKEEEEEEGNEEDEEDEDEDEDEEEEDDDDDDDEPTPTRPLGMELYSNKVKIEVLWTLENLALDGAWACQLMNRMDVGAALADYLVTMQGDFENVEKKIADAEENGRSPSLLLQEKVNLVTKVLHIILRLLLEEGRFLAIAADEAVKDRVDEALALVESSNDSEEEKAVFVKKEEEDVKEEWTRIQYYRSRPLAGICSSSDRVFAIFSLSGSSIASWNAAARSIMQNYITPYLELTDESIVSEIGMHQKSNLDNETNSSNYQQSLSNSEMDETDVQVQFPQQSLANIWNQT